jgi:lipid-binding SYLF domain-containing protein
MPKTQEDKAVLSAEVKAAISTFKTSDPTLQRFFDRSAGYAVLPKVFKGGIWVGGAHGKGHLFEKGNMVGFCSMSQASLGFTFGGEFFREIIFFRDKEDLDKFKSEEFTFSAQISAVALEAGAAGKADYKQGMLVIISTDAGLMVDASVGGQKFKYTPISVY